MTQLREELALITAKTLEHYSERAADFWEGTREHDVKQNIEALLRHIRGAPPLRILDFGCGPGRDLAAFRSLGHEPIGLAHAIPRALHPQERLLGEILGEAAIADVGRERVGLRVRVERVLLGWVAALPAPG